jgi:hypothetical protein
MVAFGKGQAFHHEVPFQSLDVEKAQSSDMLLYGSRFQLAGFEKVGRVFTDLVGAEQIGSGVVVFGKIPDDPEVRLCGILGVITTLEFLQHHLS